MSEIAKIVIKDKSLIVRDALLEKLSLNSRRIGYDETILAFRALRQSETP